MLPCRSCRWKAPDGPVRGAIDIQDGLCTVTCKHDWGVPGKSYTWTDPNVHASDCSGYEHAKVYRGRKCSEPPHEVAVVEPWSGSQDYLPDVTGTAHSRFNWGKATEGALILARGILHDALGEEPRRPVYHGFFMLKTRDLPDAFELSQREVLEWVDEWEKRGKESHKKGVTERNNQLTDIRQSYPYPPLDLEQETPAERMIKELERVATLGAEAAEALQGNPDERESGLESSPTLSPKGSDKGPEPSCHDSGLPSGEQLAEAEGLNEPSFSIPEISSDWWKSQPLPITSKAAFILGVTAGAIMHGVCRSIDQPGAAITSTHEVPIRACHVKAACFDGDDKDALCRKAQEFLAWYYGTGPSEMPEWLEWEGEDG